MKSFLNFLVQILLPERCINCHQKKDILCQDCLALIDRLNNNVCPLCGNFVNLPGKVCTNCKRKTFLDGLIVPANYKDPVIKKSISFFKYPPFLKELAKPLAFLIISQIQLQNNKFEDFLVSFIPITQKRKKFRGFNQSEEIAKIVAKDLNLPLFCLLERKKETIPQTELTKKEREENIKGVFEIKKENSEILKNRKILIVDDVYTTGSTLNEASRVLKEAGAKEVWGLVVAREF